MTVAGSSEVSWQADSRARTSHMTEPTGPVSNAQVLVDRARVGDQAAFENLVRLHADRLHAVVRRLVDDEHDAQEVTQETFLRAWRAIGKFKGDSQFFTWLYRIGVNEANRRTARNRSRPVASLDDQIEPADGRPGPAQSLQHRDLRRALEQAISELKPEYRAPLVLRDVEGFSTTQAAEILSLGEAAFKSRLHRARLEVRSAIRDYLPEDAQP
jgi:RNA polymerase sigma-70 factor (ECF subfamily)